MLVPDVNLLINAETRSSPHHESARAWLELAGNGGESVAVPEMVLMGFVRITTGSGFGAGRIAPQRAFEVCSAVRQMPAFVVIHEGPRHWPLFEDVVRRTRISGRRVTDAYLAAFAIENDATFVTFDRGFRRFPGLRLEVLE